MARCQPKSLEITEALAGPGISSSKSCLKRWLVPPSLILVPESLCLATEHFWVTKRQTLYNCLWDSQYTADTPQHEEEKVVCKYNVYHKGVSSWNCAQCAINQKPAQGTTNDTLPFPSRLLFLRDRALSEGSWGLKLVFSNICGFFCFVSSLLLFLLRYFVFILSHSPSIF